ncbi:MAG: hypothetical protein WDZ75_01870 [Candidatus Paceibacterota bacterium]
MGIHRNRGTRLALRITSFFILWLLAFVLPWWIIFLIAAILVFAGTSSAEIILIGLFLDFFFLDINSGVYGLFYSLFFFSIVIASVIINSILKNNET